MKTQELEGNIVITGFSGTGKSLVAEEVARRLNWRVVDTDEEIVKASGKPIADIFREDGEEKFRELEREAIAKACRRSQTVIAVGGGAMVDGQNRELLARSGLVVCLEARPETIHERLFREAARTTGTEVRPLLAVDNPLERIRQLKALRQPYYAAVDWTVHTDSLSIAQVVEEVIRAWRILGKTHPHLNPLPSRERKERAQRDAVSSDERKEWSQREAVSSDERKEGAQRDAVSSGERKEWSQPEGVSSREPRPLWQVEAGDDTPPVIASPDAVGTKQSRRKMTGLPRFARNDIDGDNDVDRDVVCWVETAARRYPVYVGYGLLDRLAEKMKQAGLSGAAIIISDENVFALCGSRVEGTLKQAGLVVHSLAVPAGEATKRIEYAVKIYDFLVERRAERDDVIVALGGGMVGDLAGFVAATFLRGMPWVQVPTSLIAMVDASIGGKVGVDHPEAKNLIGAFYQPHLVLADPEVLATLPQRELTSGWAEVVKHGLILDEGLVEFLESNVRGLKELEPELLTGAIARSAAIKVGVVSQDETEREGTRILLNYGHTIAHGLEAATGYGRFLHGEAVAIGMMGAARLSQRLGLLSSVEVERQEALLRAFGLPVSLSAGCDREELSLAAITAPMELDKKVRGKAIRWVLLNGIGKAVVRNDVPRRDVLAVLQELVRP